MNRNQESHFSRIPQMHHQRSVFDRSYSHMTTGNFGQIIPILTQEILPGDTVQLETSKVVRLQTMLAPVYGNMYLDTYFFFVPNRLCWKHWKEFMGENTTSAWIPSVSYSIPTIASPSSGGYMKGSVADHMGFPIGIPWTKNAGVSALPFRALALICNDFFRDQNIMDPLVTDDSDADRTAVNPTTDDPQLDDVISGVRCYTAAKYHDYFTSCLPAPQKGPTVKAVGTLDKAIPVCSTNLNHDIFRGTDGMPVPIKATWGTQSQFYTGSLRYGTATNQVQIQPGSQTDTMRDWSPLNLWTVPGDQTDAISFTINSLRIATLTQMYFEALARGGSRYEEQIEQFFGVTNPDSRVQHPEYLGGNRMQINVHEITNTAQSETDFLGDIGAKSVSADRHFDVSKSFTEHGWLIGVCVARYDHVYSQGMPRQFMRRDKLDFYNPIFANIGEQPVYKYEIAAATNYLTNPNEHVFGYQEAWASYRYAPNYVSGELRPQVEGNLAHWTLADNYRGGASLSAAWLREDPTNVDRALAVTHTVSDQLFMDFYFNFKHTRPMPMYSVPGAIGQF